MEITGEVVWHQLQQDPRFLYHPDGVREALKPLIDQLPTLLADLLDLPVTAERILNAKARFLDFCLRTRLDKKIIEAYPSVADQPGASLYERMFVALVDYKRILFHPQRFLEKLETDEDGYVIDQLVLSTELESTYLSGQLTMGQLLLALPLIFIRHDAKP